MATENLLPTSATSGVGNPGGKYVGKAAIKGASSPKKAKKDVEERGHTY